MVDLLRRQTQEGPDCFRTALACLMQVQRAEVPDFVNNEKPGGSWLLDCRKWLASRMLGIVSVPIKNGTCDCFLPHGAMVIATGDTTRGSDAHSVLMCIMASYRVTASEAIEMCTDLGFVHDPHPSRAGLRTIDRLYFIMPIDGCSHG